MAATKRDCTDIIAKYRAGSKINDLAKEYRMTRTGMYLLLKSRGEPIRNDRVKVDTDDVVDLYNKGRTMKQIAEKHNVSVSAISLILKKKGVSTRRTAPPISKKELGEAFKEFKKDFAAFGQMGTDDMLDFPEISALQSVL